jgi:hypothetical protein
MLSRLAALIVCVCTANAVVPPLVEGFKVGGDVSPSGKEVQTDLPTSLRKHNIASKGLGCCVFQSLSHSAAFQSVPQLYGMPQWMVEKGIPGGGHPGKVDQLLPQISKDRGLPTPAYVQHTGGDLSFLKQALDSGRMPCVTYAGMDPRYGLRQRIAHMVNICLLTDTEAAVLDNNFPDQLIWMSTEEFKQRWLGNSGGWAVVLCGNPPPPVPHN